MKYLDFLDSLFRLPRHLRKLALENDFKVIVYRL
jgi:hypothetical protein